MAEKMHAQIGDPSCENQAIGGNDFKPFLLYMLKVSNSTTDVDSGEWFKVDEEGYNPTTKKWRTVSYDTDFSSWLSPVVENADHLRIP
jgi:cellulase